MPTLKLTDQQVVDLVEQLSPEHKRAALLSLAAQAVARRDQRMQTMESQLRQVSAARGLERHLLPLGTY